jgi:hypothetical protein
MDDLGEFGLTIGELVPCYLTRLVKINMASTQPIWLRNQTFLSLNSNYKWDNHHSNMGINNNLTTSSWSEVDKKKKKNHVYKNQERKPINQKYKANESPKKKKKMKTNNQQKIREKNPLQIRFKVTKWQSMITKKTSNKKAVYHELTSDGDVVGMMCGKD